jgi:hypothetical protein
MTKEKLEKAKQLLAVINELEDQKSRWENAKSIYRLELSTATERCRNERLRDVDKRWVNFEELRLLAIAKITKRLEELQQEFDNL